MRFKGSRGAVSTSRTNATVVSEFQDPRELQYRVATRGRNRGPQNTVVPGVTRPSRSGEASGVAVHTGDAQVTVGFGLGGLHVTVATDGAGNWSGRLSGTVGTARACDFVGRAWRTIGTGSARQARTYITGTAIWVVGSSGTGHLSGARTLCRTVVARVTRTGRLDLASNGIFARWRDLARGKARHIGVESRETGFLGRRCFWAIASNGTIVCCWGRNLGCSKWTI